MTQSLYSDTQVREEARTVQAALAIFSPKLLMQLHGRPRANYGG